MHAGSGARQAARIVTDGGETRGVRSAHGSDRAEAALLEVAVPAAVVGPRLVALGPNRRRQREVLERRAAARPAAILSAGGGYPVLRRIVSRDRAPLAATARAVELDAGRIRRDAQQPRLATGRGPDRRPCVVGVARNLRAVAVRAMRAAAGRVVPDTVAAAHEPARVEVGELHGADGARVCQFAQVDDSARATPRTTSGAARA